jgi:hypothetical protein
MRAYEKRKVYKQFVRQQIQAGKWADAKSGEWRTAPSEHTTFKHLVAGWHLNK